VLLMLADSAIVVEIPGRWPSLDHHRRWPALDHHRRGRRPSIFNVRLPTRCWLHDAAGQTDCRCRQQGGVHYTHQTNLDITGWRAAWLLRAGARICSAARCDQRRPAGRGCPIGASRRRVPQPARKLTGLTLPGEAGGLSGPRLHAVNVAGLGCGIAHRLRQSALHRVLCRRRSIRSRRRSGIGGGDAASGSAGKCPGHQRLFRLAATDGIGPGGRQFGFLGAQEAYVLILI
jgi:hypothetical protein